MPHSMSVNNHSCLLWLWNCILRWLTSCSDVYLIWKCKDLWAILKYLLSSPNIQLYVYYFIQCRSNYRTEILNVHLFLSMFPKDNPCISVCYGWPQIKVCITLTLNDGNWSWKILQCWLMHIIYVLSQVSTTYIERWKLIVEDFAILAYAFYVVSVIAHVTDKHKLCIAY